jgi:uncharacterized protein involved in exopolysaccharide biosynthesis
MASTDGTAGIDDSIDIFSLVFAAKWVLLAAGLVGGIVGYGASHLTDKMYRAMVVAAPFVDSSESGASSLGSQLGGLAAIAGVDLSGDAKKQESMAILQSRQLIRQFIQQQDLIPILFPKKWDAAARNWKQDSGKPPTLEAAVTKFQKQILKISEDKRSGMVNLSVNWRDPVIAASWANDYLSMANAAIRSRAIVDGKRNIELLRHETESLENVDVRQSLNRLIEGNYRKISLAESRPDYAFHVVDPAGPIDPDDYVSPVRIVWALLASIVFGGSVLVFLMRKQRRILQADTA